MSGLRRHQRRSSAETWPRIEQPSLFLDVSDTNRSKATALSETFLVFEIALVSRFFNVNYSDLDDGLVHRPRARARARGPVNFSILDCWMDAIQPDYDMRDGHPNNNTTYTQQRIKAP